MTEINYDHWISGDTYDLATHDVRRFTEEHVQREMVDYICAKYDFHDDNHITRWHMARALWFVGDFPTCRWYDLRDDHDWERIHPNLTRDDLPHESNLVLCRASWPMRAGVELWPGWPE